MKRRKKIDTPIDLHDVSKHICDLPEWFDSNTSKFCFYQIDNEVEIIATDKNRKPEKYNKQTKRWEVLDAKPQLYPGLD